MIHSDLLLPGVYYILIKPECRQGDHDLTLNISGIPTECWEPPCESCISKFSPMVGEHYMFSAWVRVEVEVEAGISWFDDVGVVVYFLDEAEEIVHSIPIHTTGPFVDDWQRIQGDFIIPEGAEQLRIEFFSDMPPFDDELDRATFDDVRIEPYDASMKCYVYDRDSRRLMAELDERNYATFYEYDQDGTLVRVKKETERGIMTVREMRQNTSKFYGE